MASRRSYSSNMVKNYFLLFAIDKRLEKSSAISSKYSASFLCVCLLYYFIPFSFLARGKKDANCLEKMRTLSRQIIISWTERFGHDSISGKQYLHMLTHLWEIGMCGLIEYYHYVSRTSNSLLEKFALDHGFATADKFSMQGREHRNKILAAFLKRHNAGSNFSQRKPYVLSSISFSQLGDERPVRKKKWKNRCENQKMPCGRMLSSHLV